MEDRSRKPRADYRWRPGLAIFPSDRLVLQPQSHVQQGPLLARHDPDQTISDVTFLAHGVTTLVDVALPTDRFGHDLLRPSSDCDC